MTAYFHTRTVRRARGRGCAPTPSFARAALAPSESTPTLPARAAHLTAAAGRPPGAGGLEISARGRQTVKRTRFPRRNAMTIGYVQPFALQAHHGTPCTPKRARLPPLFRAPRRPLIRFFGRIRGYLALARGPCLFRLRSGVCQRPSAWRGGSPRAAGCLPASRTRSDPEGGCEGLGRVGPRRARSLFRKSRLAILSKWRTDGRPGATAGCDPVSGWRSRGG